MRILVVQTSFLGDVVLSTPMFAALRAGYPDAHITVMVRPETAGILEGHPHVDALLVDDKRGAHRGVGSLRMLRRLRRERFDIALALHKSFRTAWLLAAAGIPLRIGFRQSAGWFLYHRRVVRNATRHDCERNFSLLEGLGMASARTASACGRPYVACSAEAQQRFQALLRERGIPAHAFLVGIAPGSVWATKRWTIAGFGMLVRSLCHDLGVTPILLGAKADGEYAAAIEAAAGAAALNLVGQTDLALLTAAIDQCSVLVSNDSAPMHIAVARETPVVALFGPTSPRQGYGPYTDRAIVVERDLSCRPCSRHGGARCPIGTHACMREIGAPTVMQAVLDLLQREGVGPAAATV